MRSVKCWSQEKSAVHLAQVPCFCLLALGTDPQPRVWALLAAVTPLLPHPGPR